MRRVRALVARRRAGLDPAESGEFPSDFRLWDDRIGAIADPRAGFAPRRGTLEATTAQLDAVRERIGDGVTRTCHALQARTGTPCVVEIERVACCALSEFADGAVCRHSDRVAGVVARFEGPISGAGLIALEPEDAFAWTRAHTTCDDPLAAYVELGTELLSGPISALAEGFGADVCVTPGRLEEEGVATILLATHAPSDTALISVGLVLATEELAIPVDLYLLVDPKALAAVLAGGED